MNAYIARAVTLQVTCVGGFLSSVRSQNATPQWRKRHVVQSQCAAEHVHRREELKCITVLCIGHIGTACARVLECF